MKRKIMSMLMVMVILFTAVDMSVFASETTVSGNEVQSVTEEVVDDVEENEGEEVTVSRNGDAGQDLIVDDKEIRVLEEEGKNKSAEDEVVIENKAILTEVIQEENNVKDSLVFEGGDGTIDNPYTISERTMT